MTEMSDLMQELACAVRQKNFERAEEALTIISARYGYSREIQRGRYQATPHKSVEMDTSNVVTIHDLPSRDGIVIDNRHGVPKWRPAA